MKLISRGIGIGIGLGFLSMFCHVSYCGQIRNRILFMFARILKDCLCLCLCNACPCLTGKANGFPCLKHVGKLENIYESIAPATKTFFNLLANIFASLEANLFREQCF